MTNITKISLAVEIDGKPYFVNLPFYKLRILLDSIPELTDNGKMPVIAAPEGWQFSSVYEKKEP